MNKALSEVPFEEIQVGQKVISAIGHKGEIVELVPEDDKTIWIDWETGNSSSVYHTQAERVIFVG